MSPSNLSDLRGQCRKFLMGSRPEDYTARKILLELAAMPEAELEPDHYGKEGPLPLLEAEAAQLLGKEAAVFMVSGTMAQQIALRIWSERKGLKTVAFHPKCHLEIHEDKGYQALHGLHGVLVGHPERLITLDDLKAVRDPLAALLLELPQREIGGQLPAWGDLVSQAAWARQKGVALHMDGARLWECKPFYGREYSQIAGLFDSVYVSLYKILGGIAGSLLLGPADFISEARLWQHRHGGTLIRQYPMALAALKGLREELGNMQRFHDKALEIAAALTPIPGIELVPNPPHANMLHINLRGTKERLEQAAEEIIRERGFFLFWGLAPTSLPGWQKFELTVRKPACELETAEIAEVFAELMEKAGG